MSSNLIVNNIEVGAGATVYTSASNQLAFGTNGSEKVRITSDGIIETGTAVGASGADGDQRLRVGREGNCNIAVRATASTTAYTGIDFGDSGDDRAGRIQYMHNGDYMSFHTNGAGTGSSNERLRINHNGSIQITPEASTSNPYMLIDTSGDSVRFSAKKSSGNNEFRFLTQSSGTVTEKLRITSTGNVVINSETSGEAKLDVHGGVAISSNSVAVSPSGYDLKIRSNTSKLGIHCDSGSGTPILEFGTGGSTGCFITNLDNTPMRFGTQNTERMRIQGTGGVGLSTTLIRNQYFMNIAAPSQAFSGSTNLMDGGGICFQGTDNSFATGRTYPGIFWSGNTASLGRARAGILGISAANNDATDIVFLTRSAADGTSMTPADEQVRITSNGQVKLDNELRTNRIVPKDGLPSGSSGGIIQVKQVIHSQYVKYDTNSWSRGELSNGSTGNFEITITPTRSDSKILVSLNSFYDSYHNQRTYIAIFRGASTNLGGGRGHCEIHNDQGRLQAMLSAQHLDSPNTTNPVTYTVQAKTESGSFYLGLYNNNKWLTAMEVTG